MMENKLFGIGINDTDIITQKQKGKSVLWRNPYYDRWSNMLRRCYSEKYQKSFPTYLDCIVCEEWLRFSNFKLWMENQDWNGKQLDKDLLGTGKLYSPDNCCFISPAINSYIIIKDINDGFPLGVSLSKNKYQKSYRVRSRYGCIHLGTFNNDYEAHREWQKQKIKVGLSLISAEKDVRVVDKLKHIVNKISEDLSMGLETTPQRLKGD